MRIARKKSSPATVVDRLARMESSMTEDDRRDLHDFVYSGCIDGITAGIAGWLESRGVNGRGVLESMAWNVTHDALVKSGGLDFGDAYFEAAAASALARWERTGGKVLRDTGDVPAEVCA